MLALSVVAMLSCVVPQQTGAGRSKLEVTNSHWEFIEFRIRASERNRSWTKVGLRRGKSSTITLASEDPFDIQVWKYIAGGYWQLESAQSVPLSTYSGGRGGYVEPFQKWHVDASGRQPRYGYLGNTRKHLIADEGILRVELVPTLFTEIR